MPVGAIANTDSKCIYIKEVNISTFVLDFNSQRDWVLFRLKGVIKPALGMGMKIPAM